MGNGNNSLAFLSCFFIFFRREFAKNDFSFPEKGRLFPGFSGKGKERKFFAAEAGQSGRVRVERRNGSANAKTAPQGRLSAVYGVRVALCGDWVRLSAVSASLSACLLGGGFALRRGLPFGKGASRSGLLCGVRVRLAANAFGNDSRAPPCTRKGHRPLTPGRRKTCVLLVVGSGSPYGGDCLSARAQAVPACFVGFGCAWRRMPSAIVLRAPPCTRKGHRPLTSIRRKTCVLLVMGPDCACRGLSGGNWPGKRSKTVEKR